MYAFTLTPLGRMLNAVRDNPERVEFVGYSTQRVRYLAFMIAGFFAGIGGALAAINFEIVNASDSLSAVRSGGYLLFTFLGGATFFFGPMIGAVLLVLASVLLSGGDQGLAPLPRPDLPVHGDVRARRHRQPDHDERARRRAQETAPALGLVRGADGRRRR
jgi:ABC-type branched-subunit amino acid transport system permease subunit